MKIQFERIVRNNDIYPQINEIVTPFFQLNIKWKVCFLTGVGQLPSGVSILDLEEEINESTGKYYSVKDLESTFFHLDDLQEIELIGESNDNGRTIVCINLYDSSYWELESNDENVIKNYFMKSEFLFGYKPISNDII